MTLDPRSVILVIVTVNVLAGGGLLAATRGYLGQVSGATRWAWAALVQALGWLIAGTFRGVLPDVLSVVLGNGLIQLSLTLYLSAVCALTGQRPALRGFFVLVAAEAAALAFFTAGYPDLFGRQAVISASVSAVTWRSACVLRSGPHRHEASHRFMVGVFAVTALGFALRSAMTATWIGAGEFSEGTFASSPFTSLSFLTFFIVTATLPFGFALMCCDRYVDDLRQAQEALARSAFVDALTQLPNRTMITSRLRAIVGAGAERAAGISAVLFIDLDNFKYVNDSLGHEAGDQLLRETATRLTRVIQEGSTVPSGADAIAGRFGGDEFVVVLNRLDTTDRAIAVAQQILASIAEPFRLAGQPAAVRCSIGISANAGRYTDVETLLRDADAAMYRAKAAGRANYVVFDEQMHVEARRRQRLGSDLRRAIGTDQIAVCYEPIIDLATGRVSAFEAMVRWRHPEYGIVAADEFNSIADETGLVVQLGQIVVEHAVAVLKRMMSMPGHESIGMHIRLSRRQLIDKQFRQCIGMVAARLGVSTDRLNLEIGEASISLAAAVSAEILGELKRLGVRLHLANFGAGLSSVRLLRALPIDGLKIERSFIDAADRDVEAIAILNAIVTLGHNLGKTVTIEGIGDPRALATVLALECERAQGDLFGPPLSADDVETALASDYSSYCLAA